MYQVVRVPNYNHQTLQTGRTLQTEIDEGGTDVELDSHTGFVVDQFALLGWDDELEHSELAQVSAIDPATHELTVSALSYWHGADHLVWPVPFDQVELLKKASGASTFQLLQRKAMDVDDEFTSFVDDVSQEGDTYQYRYRNTVTEAVSTASSTGIKYVRAQEPYVTPADVLEYMGHPESLVGANELLTLLCTAYSDQADHLVGRYKKNRLWYHPEWVTVSMWDVSSDFKVRISSKNATPIKQVVSAYIYDPEKGKKYVVPKPYLVKNTGMLYFPNLDDADVSWDDTYQLSLELETGFFDEGDVPSDLAALLCENIANHFRQEDFLRKFTTASGETVLSGVASNDEIVKSISIGKYAKTFVDASHDVTSTSVTISALEAMGVVVKDSKMTADSPALRPYRRTFSAMFI